MKSYELELLLLEFIAYAIKTWNLSICVCSRGADS